MDDFFDKDVYSEEDINSLIDNEIEEALNLEFKEARALMRTDEKKREISKDVSSFANSSGGIKIYGIDENNHNASTLSYVDGNDFTKEWLEQVIQTNIHRKIDGLQIIPVRFNEKINNSVYVVKIPESNSSPHMAKDNKYYKRHNFNIMPMEEHEVRALYNQSTRTELNIKDLRITWAGSQGSKQGGFEYIAYDLDVCISNESNSIEEKYKIEFKVPVEILGSSHSDPSLEYINIIGDYGLAKIPNSDPLFQHEESHSLPIRVRIRKSCFASADNFKVLIRLYYSNGFKYKEFDLLRILTFDSEPITEGIFRG